MQKKAFLLQLALVGTLGIALTSCGNTSSETSSSEEVSSEAKAATATGYDSGTFDVTGVEGAASGAYSYLGKSYSDKTTILGSLEKYAYQNYLTGLPLYENGAYVMYNSRLVKGTENYITGYGFSNLRDGYITSDMAKEETTAYKKYLHSWESSDPGTINALDSDGSQVSDLYGYMSSGLFGNKMNKNKDGYEWYGVLSNDDKPLPVGSDGNLIASPTSTTLSDTWRIHVKTNTEGVTYRTGSAKADRAAFDGRKIVLEDYVTPFKILLNQKNGYYRGSELASQTGKSGIVGAAAYYNATGDGDTSTKATDAWKNVGIKTGTDTDGDYIQFQFMAPTNRFYAMYQTAESLYQPVPKAFFDLVGADKYGAYNSDKTETPVDNILSVGPYYLSTWETDKAITFKKNDSWFESTADTSLYRIPGVHFAILSGYASDKALPIKEFLNGSLDSASIPDDYLATYKDDPRTTTVPGSSTFKLNINSCTEDQWADKFGTNGSITRTATSDYWDVKPWMSNSNFLDGLMASIDRKTFAEDQGTIPSLNYFASAYMSDPENGVSYDNTDQHNAAIEAAFPYTYNTYGYSQTVAKTYFKNAVTELVNAGKLTLGTKANPTIIKIDIEWMYDYQITGDGAKIASYFTSAFNDDSVADGKVQLKVEQHAGANWYDVYYSQLMVGQFDLGFGSISGNTLDPLNFMEVLKSNNSSGFTLNWGPDTSEIVTGDKALTYGGVNWSFDTLWKATDQGVILNKGMELPPVVLKYGSGDTPIDSDGNLTFTLTPELVTDKFTDLKTKTSVEIDDLYIYGSKLSEYFDLSTAEGDYVTTTYNSTTGVLTIKLAAEAVDYFYSNVGGFYFGADFTLTITDDAGTKVSSSSYVEGQVILG